MATARQLATAAAVSRRLRSHGREEVAKGVLTYGNGLCARDRGIRCHIRHGRSRSFSEREHAAEE